MTSPTVTLRTPNGTGPPLPDHAELLLEEFLRSRRIEPGTKEIYRQALQNWDRRIETRLEDARSEDVAAWFARISGEGLSPGTIALYGIKLRVLYAWTLRRRGLKKRAAASEAGDLFEEVPFADLKRQADRENELRDKVLTPEEYEALMAASDHPRVRAVLATLYEAAGRPSEILGLRIRDLEFCKGYAKVRVSGKTGERTIPLVRAIPYLRAWLQVHPARGDADAPLFAHVYHGQFRAVTSNGLATRIRRLRQRAGIKRRIYPYMFRHTRLTELADNDLGEYKMKVLAGWTPDSRQAARYIHLSGHSSVAPILEMEGVEVPDEAQPRESPIRVGTCPACLTVNEGDALFCMRCGLALDEKAGHLERRAVAETDGLMDALMKSPKVRAALEEAMGELLREGALPTSGGTS